MLLLAGLSCANVATEGGNITNANVSSVQNATWHAVVGLASTAAFGSLVVPATPGGVTRTTIGTGSSACTSGVAILNLLFSNSSSLISGLSPGNLSALDSFINNNLEGGTATFANLTNFSTSAYGTIPSVPTTYTNSPSPGSFPMGYLQDSQRNLVFIMPVNGTKPGFDSGLYDFQFMLPTNNAATTLYYLSVDMQCKSPTPTPTPTPGGGGGGGGGGGAGGGMTYASLPSVDIPVDLGNGVVCIVNVRRSMTATKDYSVVVTTLTNEGGPQCAMYDFVFEDAIPESFAPISYITFSPPYNSVKGSTVFFIFPLFSPGESRTLTYSVTGQLPQSRVQNFTTPLVLSANSGNPFLNLVPNFNITQPVTQPSTAPACAIAIYCAPWGPCGDDGYRSQHCSDISNCTSIDFFSVEKCGAPKNVTPTFIDQLLTPVQGIWNGAEQGVCLAYPQLCSAQAPPYDALCLCASAILIAALLVAISAGGMRRRKRMESGEALEPARPPIAHKGARPSPEEGAGRPSEYDSSLELPPEKAAPADRYARLSPELRSIIEERARRSEERERERRHAEKGGEPGRHSTEKEGAAHGEHRPPAHRAEKEATGHWEKKEKVSREPEWHSKGGLTIKPIYPEDEKKREERRKKHEGK